MKLKFIFSISILSALFGCGSPYTVQPDDPRFAPIIPDMVEAPTPKNGALYVANNNMTLYEDIKARNVGDILTVNLTESTSASKGADTNLKKEYDNTFAAPTILGGAFKFDLKKLPIFNSKADKTLEQGIANNSEFKGSGSSSQNNSLQGNITVTVVQVLPNKYLAISGEKWLTLNQGSEYIRLTGIVRPQDIGPSNQIVSSKIANARISYSGKGAVNNSNVAGWLAQFFNGPYMPL